MNRTSSNPSRAYHASSYSGFMTPSGNFVLIKFTTRRTFCTSTIFSTAREIRLPKARILEILLEARSSLAVSYSALPRAYTSQAAWALEYSRPWLECYRLFGRVTHPLRRPTLPTRYRSCRKSHNCRELEALALSAFIGCAALVLQQSRCGN